MLKFFKFFIAFTLIFLFIISPVFANDTAITTTVSDINETTAINNVQQENSKPITSITNDDLFVNTKDSYTLDGILYGNAFISTSNLTVTSRNKGGTIFGDLFASATNVAIQSELIYSNDKDKNGNYLVDQVKSYSVINGNVYVVATDTFTLEPKCEIHGDLYVFATNINISTDAVVDGNIFVFANSVFTLNGKVSGSVYASASQCNVGYTGYVSKDLIVSVSDSANISGKVDRTTKLNSETGKIVTTYDFITGKNLLVDTNTFEFAGEVQGEAKFNVKDLNFDTSKTCIIRGNLEYATKSEVPDLSSIVAGEVKSSNYIDKNSISYQILSKVISYIALLIYVFVIVLIFKYIAPNFIERLSNITTTNIFVGLGIGFGLLLAFIPIFILLIITKFTIALAFALLVSLLFIALISMPLFILSISNAWKSEKIKLNLRILIITTIIFVVNLIPTFGIFAIGLFDIIAIGKILLSLFYKK